MAYENIVFEKQGRIAYITLNRPEHLNAFSQEQSYEMEDIFDEFDADDDLYVAILSGKGRCFSAGADVKRVHAASLESGQPQGLQNRKRGGFLEGKNFKPVIAAVHGYCYGKGLGTALACDIIVATEDAKFCVAELRRGIGGGGLGVHLTYLGAGKMGAEVAITGRDLTGSEAHRVGLASRLVATQEELLPAATELAEQTLRWAPLAVRENVRVNRESRELFLATHRAAPGPNLRMTEDYAEAVRSFVEKRTPVWHAR